MKCQCCVGVISSMLCHAERSFFCHSERREESSMDASLRLRSVQHDRVGHCEHFFRVIPSVARNPVWMLHYAYAPFSMTGRGHSER